jgi:hypothetical protein
VFWRIPHYALLLFALLASLRWLGACWGPNVMRGAAILTSASKLANSPAGQGSRAVARNTAIAGTQSIATLRGSPLSEFSLEARKPPRFSKNDEAEQIVFLRLPHGAPGLTTTQGLHKSVQSFGTFVVKRFERNSRNKFMPTRPARPTAALENTRLAPRFALG